MSNDNTQLTQSMPSSQEIGYFTEVGFVLSQRVAAMFAKSDMVPKEFQGNVANCVIALNMAKRMGAEPLMVMQNLYIVHGTPSWSSKFLIACFNACGRFSSLRYEFEGKEGSDDWGCRAVATEFATGEKLEGAKITIGLAKKEGWIGKTGSKWVTMPEQMLRYRAAAWFIRAFAPEITMGLQTREEVEDIEPEEPPRITPPPKGATLKDMIPKIEKKEEEVSNAK